MRPLFPLLVAALPALSLAQLRLATWNVTEYNTAGTTTSRRAAFQTAIYGSYQGRFMRPDMFVGQEFASQAAVNDFLSLLNTAPGSPGDWAVAPWFNGPDSDSAFFYRTSRVQFLNASIIAYGSTSSTDQPRNTMRYDVRPLGYTGPQSTLAIYSVHMKSASGTTDQQRRQVEAQRIVDNVATLPAGWHPVICGDFNMQSSNQQAYQTLTNSVTGGGPFRDPIATPGSWNNNSTFRFVHTQEPSVGMDDRYDFILLGGFLMDNRGLDYLGQGGVKYSTTTWDDPNHSYRAWGNDGSTFNLPLNPQTNAMVGPAIAQALKDTVNGAGHLPVFLDFRVPGKLKMRQTALNFGKLRVGRSTTAVLDLNNVADINRWGVRGVMPLTYSFTLPSMITLRNAPVALRVTRDPMRHYFTIRPTTAGRITGTITLTTDDPDNPTVQIPYSAYAY